MFESKGKIVLKKGVLRRKVYIPYGTESLDRDKLEKIIDGYSHKDIISIEIPDSVRVIEDKTFQDCGLLEEVRLNKKQSMLVFIGKYAFEYCYKLKRFDFPNSLAHIGESALRRSGIITADLGETRVSYLGDCAFDGCTSLEKFVISKELYVICGSVFSGCKKLNVVDVKGRNEFVEYDAYDNVLAVQDGNGYFKKLANKTKE